MTIPELRRLSEMLATIRAREDAATVPYLALLPRDAELREWQKTHDMRQALLRELSRWEAKQ
jgi:hypothetical protein